MRRVFRHFQRRSFLSDTLERPLLVFTNCFDTQVAGKLLMSFDSEQCFGLSANGDTDVERSCVGFWPPDTGSELPGGRPLPVAILQDTLLWLVAREGQARPVFNLRCLRATKASDLLHSIKCLSYFMFLCQLRKCCFTVSSRYWH